MHNDDVRHQEPPFAASNAAAATDDRWFEIPSVSTEVLRKLQGALCIRCGVAGGQLYADGRAFTVSPGDSAPLAWDVRSHAKCMGKKR